MKKLIILATVLLTSLTSQAQTLEAKSIKNLLAQVEASDFKFQERGMVFGFNTIQSCMYVGNEIVVIKNYCWPAKEYPAKGYTIITPEAGMIDLYEEKLPHVFKREFNITQFPEILAPYLRHPFPSASLEDMSQMIGKLHYQYNPACWSSNYSYYTEEAVATCNVPVDSIVAGQEWLDDTQELTADVNKWNTLIKAIEAKLK